MIITVAHTKGGVGKSTIAWNLAHSFEEIGKTVKLVDLDFNQSLFFINQIPDKPPMTVLQAETYEELLEAIATDPTDVCIIDVGGFDSELNRAAFATSDIVLIPVGDSITEVLGLMTFEPILSAAAPDVTAVAVLNGIHPAAKNLDDLRVAIGSWIKPTTTVIRTRSAYRQTIKRGKSVFDIADMAAREEIRGVRDELLKGVNHV